MKIPLKWLLFAVVCTVGACNKDDDSDNQSLNQNDRNFMTNASYGNNAEVSAGQMAHNKTADGSIDAFAQMMITDHQAAQTELQTIAQNMSDSLPTGMDAAHQALAQQLAAMSGRMFDSSYIHSQVTDHQRTIQLFQDEISNGHSQRLKDYANKYLPRYRAIITWQTASRQCTSRYGHRIFLTLTGYHHGKSSDV